MVLPGVQALFGFQLIAVFNDGFAEKLSAGEQRLHLLALALVAIAGALIMTPAAYHRQTGPHVASRRFLELASRLLLLALVPLIGGVGLDFYLIARIVLENRLLAGASAGALALLFAALWFALPRLGRAPKRSPS
jgi:hypothetical protein